MAYGAGFCVHYTGHSISNPKSIWHTPFDLTDIHNIDSSKKTEKKNQFGWKKCCFFHCRLLAIQQFDEMSKNQRMNKIRELTLCDIRSPFKWAFLNLIHSLNLWDFVEFSNGQVCIGNRETWNLFFKLVFCFSKEQLTATVSGKSKEVCQINCGLEMEWPEHIYV